MLPYDLDANLAGQLAEAAKSLEAMAKDLDDLQSTESPTQNDMDKLLEKLAKQLASGRRSFDEKASQPLEHLSKIFPLIADQQRFLIIAARQRDLAERLASVKGQDTVTDPATKARLRDLEGEQHRLRDDLQSLLTDIENHARSLPEDEKLQELRVSALKFAKAVKDSGAEAAMADAESALTEFAGTRGHAKAQEAAEILARFISQCQGVGGQAGACLVFQPGLASGMGNTVAQLLAEMGMGDGSGGGGAGMSGGGYSAVAVPASASTAACPRSAAATWPAAASIAKTPTKGPVAMPPPVPAATQEPSPIFRPSPKPAAPASLWFRRDTGSAWGNISSGSPMKSAIRAKWSKSQCDKPFPAVSRGSRRSLPLAWAS